jgi:hypothetical protein
MNLLSFKKLLNNAAVVSRFFAVFVLVGVSFAHNSSMAQTVSEGFFVIEEKEQDEIRSITVGIPKTGLLKATRVSGWKARYDSVEIAKAKSALVSLNETVTNVQ